MVSPDAVTAPMPAADMPDDVRTDYEEARVVAARSARSAAALLRVAVQKLCSHLGGTGKNIDADIAAMVKGGLRTEIQQGLDVLRVIGNNAVHPGQIDFADEDNADVAGSLFVLVNMIVETMITEPKRAAEMFARLPPGARAAIERRDAT